eukprot:s964_g8.t1
MDAVAETVQQLIEGMQQRSALCSEDSLEELSTAFMNSSFSESMEPTEYLKWLRCNVLEREVVIESPMMMGHMTTKLPSYMPDLGKLVTAMNLNLVKTETAKVTTFLEREAIAVLHKEIFHQDDAFYARHVQCRSSSLGVMTSGGTAANIQALWMARQRLFPDAESKGLFPGAMPRRAVVLTSALAHYSLEKAMCLLGLGCENLIKVETLSDFSVDVGAMKRVVQSLEKDVQVMAIVGLAGATETGHVDDLEALADLAASLGAHFHVDAAWGFPLLLDGRATVLSGAERADTVAVDGHKLLYTPMGCGTLLMRDPCDPSRICKSARYIIREDSFDQGRFTLEGSRPAMAIYLHMNLRCLGRQGLLSRIATGCALAQRLAEMLRKRDPSSFELITDPPQSNIVLYRYIPRKVTVFQKALIDALFLAHKTSDTAMAPLLPLLALLALTAAEEDVCTLVQHGKAASPKSSGSRETGTIQQRNAVVAKSATAMDGSQLTKLMRLKQELSQLSGELDGILGAARGSLAGAGTVSHARQRGGDLDMFGSDGRQNIIINNSKIYGNVIGGNNAASITSDRTLGCQGSDFIGNTMREFSISAGDTEWKHRVFMPIGNTEKSVDVSANGTDINHNVSTDLFDGNEHTLGATANSRSFASSGENVATSNTANTSS